MHNEPFKKSKTVESLNKSEFNELLSLTTKDSHVFWGTLHKQIDGVAMGSPLDPVLANAFLVYQEKYWLERCPLKYRLFYYWSYNDYVFILFNSLEHLKRFQSYLISRHANKYFTTENKKDSRMPFIVVNLIREQGKFTIWQFINIQLQNWHNP